MYSRDVCHPDYVPSIFSFCQASKTGSVNVSNRYLRALKRSRKSTLSSLGRRKHRLGDSDDLHFENDTTEQENVVGDTELLSEREKEHCEEMSDKFDQSEKKKELLVQTLYCY